MTESRRADRRAFLRGVIASAVAAPLGVKAAPYLYPSKAIFQNVVVHEQGRLMGLPHAPSKALAFGSCYGRSEKVCQGQLARKHGSTTS